MSGMLNTTGSLDTSSQASVYSVSALGAAQQWLSTAGYVRMRIIWPIGACSASACTVTLVCCLRAMSKVTSG
jgi:hypothetical protein